MLRGRTITSVAVRRPRYLPRLDGYDGGGEADDMRLTAAVIREDNGYVARCIEVNVVSQGDTFEEAMANL